MEVLLFTLFFIASLVFFISGKDDFGRKENKSLIKINGKEEVINEAEFEQKVKIKERQNWNAINLKGINNIWFSLSQKDSSNKPIMDFT